MFQKKLIIMLGAAVSLTLLSVQPALAQATTRPGDPGTTAVRAGEGFSNGNDRRRERQARRAAAPTPEQNREAAQTVLTAAGIECQVSEATLLGVTAEQHATYEAVCAGGPGYVLVASTPPQTFNCLELSGQAETTRLRDPAADVGQQCTLPVNLDPVPVLSTYAREAGIDCTVDKASAFGRSPEGNLIYEIGCVDRDGYWLEKANNAWKKTPCWELGLQNITCRYSTAAESLGVWKTILAGTEAAACDVQQGRRVGRDAQGVMVYEVKCGAGDGFFVRVSDAYAAQRVHPCATSQHIAGGCTLTTTAPAASVEQ